MGGIGSGAPRSTKVGDVEDALAIDIRQLRRLGVVRLGECVCDTICWSIDGLSTSSARVRVDLSDIERGGTMTITSDMPDGAIKQHIGIELMTASLGGHRCYFICPVTARRCEIIYSTNGRFASRAAQRLSYSVQGLNDLSRARRKAAKLHSRLYRPDALSRPRGRNRIEKIQQLHRAEYEAKMLYYNRLHVLADRSGSHQIPSNK